MNSSNQWFIVLLCGTFVVTFLLSLFYRNHIYLFVNNFEMFFNYALNKNFIQIVLLLSLM